MATIQFTENITFTVIECASCGVQFGLEENHRQHLIKYSNTFYCPNGHANVYGQNAKDKLLAELKRKEQELADTAIQKRRLENELIEKENILAQKIKQLLKTSRDLKRLENGVCPCCNRSFHNLQQHIANEHPELVGKEKMAMIYYFNHVNH